MQELYLSRGFQSSVEPTLIFGMGSRRTANLNVYWPDGSEQMLKGIKAGENIVIEYKPESNSTVQLGLAKTIFSKLADTLPFRHIENEYNDFKREPLLPHQFSKNGPALAKGDVNGDGFADFFIGGANGQAGAIFLNDKQNGFSEKKVPVFYEHRFFEDVNCFFC